MEYEFPPNVPVTQACRDLLCRILVADPLRRITIAGIQQHPWYRQVSYCSPLALADLAGFWQCCCCLPDSDREHLFQPSLDGLHECTQLLPTLPAAYASYHTAASMGPKGHKNAVPVSSSSRFCSAAFQAPNQPPACCLSADAQALPQDLPGALDTFNDICIAKQGQQQTAHNWEKIHQIVDQAKVIPPFKHILLIEGLLGAQSSLCLI